MWLLLRSPRARAALDLDKGRIWSIADDRFLTIDLPDGRLTIKFASPAASIIAAEQLLQAILESKEVFDTTDVDWDDFQAEWQYFDSSREELEPEALPEAMEDKTETDPWESVPPTDPKLRNLWERTEHVRGFPRSKQTDVEQVILEICRDEFLSALEIGVVLERSVNSVRVHFLNTMVHAGQLEKEFPEKRSHPRQRYRTATG